MPSLAARTREAVRARPALRVALAAGAVNHTAAARLIAADLDLGTDDHDAVAAALRRHAEELRLERGERQGSVRMVTGVGVVDAAGETESGSDTLLVVGDRVVREGAGSQTALVLEGRDVDARALSAALARLDAEGIDVAAAGVSEDTAVLVVGRRDGADGVRAVEDALDSVFVVAED